MTVQELINELEKIEDKDKLITIEVEDEDTFYYYDIDNVSKHFEEDYYVIYRTTNWY